MPREDDIAGNPIGKEFAEFLHLSQAVLDIGEIPLVIVRTAKEETALRGKKSIGVGVVFENPLATVDDIVHIIFGHEGEPLVPHLALVLEVGEDEIDLAEIGIVLLISHLNLVLYLLLQLRQVKDCLRIGVDFEIVVLGDKGAEFFNESEIPLVINVTPIVVGLESLPSLTKRPKEFLNLLAEIFLRKFINLFGEVAEIFVAGLLTFKGYLCVVKVNVESDSTLLF